MLSVVNSLPHQLNKRNDWSTCFTNEGTFPRLNVVTSPDTPTEGQQAKFTVSGNIPQDIDGNDQLWIIFINDDDTKDVTSYSTPACGANDLPQCPIKAGTDFSVFMEVDSVPQFPDAFDIYAVIGNPPDTTKACAYTDEWPDGP
ncbi:34192_t:CDS:1 [Racocetra persica]|uniref:34192_t:CDS:1 n=1 Tax=Racocetra persica TaxID=160502 RepID=A0ACA9LPE6_9GLOM|nr:34192_t:CDS:1 [Racocetra persica]